MIRGGGVAGRPAARDVLHGQVGLGVNLRAGSAASFEAERRGRRTGRARDAPDARPPTRPGRADRRLRVRGDRRDRLDGFEDLRRRRGRRARSGLGEELGPGRVHALVTSVEVGCSGHVTAKSGGDDEPPQFDGHVVVGGFVFVVYQRARGSVTGDVVGACPCSVYQRVTTLRQITSQSFSHIGRVSDHVHPPAGIAAAISSASARACAIFPRCRGRHNRAVSPYFRHRSMLIAAFDDRRPPDGHSPVLGRRLDPCGTTWRPLRIYSGRKVIGSSCVGRGRRPHRRQRSHADREAGRVLHNRAGRSAVSRALGRSPFSGDAHAEASLKPRHVLPATVPQDDD